MDKTIRILTYLTIITVLLIFVVGITGGYTFPKLFAAYVFTFIILSVTLFARPVTLYINNTFIQSVLFFLFTSGLAVIFAINPRIALEGCIFRNDGYVLQWVCTILFFVIIGFFKRQHIPFLINIIIYTGAVIATYGIFQYFGIDFVTWRIPKGSMCFSTLGNPAFYSAFIACIIPLVLYKIFAQSIWYLPLLPFFLVALYWGYARAAIVGFIVSIIFFITFSYKHILKQKTLMYSLIGIVVVVSAVPLFSGDRSIYRKFSYIGERGFIPRMREWKVGLRIISDYPVFGVGQDNIRSVWCSYTSPATCKPTILDGARELHAYQNHDRFEHQLYSRLHNDFLDVTANKGFIGLISYLFLLGCYFKMSWRSCKAQDLLSVSIITSVVAYLVQNQFCFGTIPQIALWWYLVAMTFVACKRP